MESSNQDIFEGVESHEMFSDVQEGEGIPQSDWESDVERDCNPQRGPGLPQEGPRGGARPGQEAGQLIGLQRHLPGRSPHSVPSV